MNNFGKQYIADVDNHLKNLCNPWLFVFCSLCDYQVNGFHCGTTGKKINGLLPKQMDFNKLIANNYCCTLTNIIEMMLKYVFLKHVT